MMRRVLDARWHDLGDGVLRFDIDAKAFCHQMVRSIAGTLVDMGRGRKRAGEMATILRARDRQGAGTVAPAQGLCLWEVVY
jgi:tRNA pseudouridine38-40 synthase